MKRVPCTARLVAALRKACEHERGARVLITGDGDEVTPKVIKRWIQIPSYPGYPFKLVFKLLEARLAMLVSF